MPISLRTLTLTSLTAAALAATAACAPTTGPAPRPMVESTAFNAADFAWSGVNGTGSVNGRIDYSRNGNRYTCTGWVALTPVTPYTRARFRNLYGSTEKAALPESVVRARTVPDPNADYRSYVRSSTCADNRFLFSGLPAGEWFVIAPVSAGGEERVVMMQRIRTRDGARVDVTL
ncbi:MAG TPA: hypothetical protein DCX75_13575 [Brevundimonas sp.]|nr:hypothetical protein [Brevundimonas sp.]